VPGMSAIAATQRNRRHNPPTMCLAFGLLLLGRRIRRNCRLRARQRGRHRKHCSRCPRLNLQTPPKSASVTSTTTLTASNAVHLNVHLDNGGHAWVSGETGSRPWQRCRSLLFRSLQVGVTAGRSGQVDARLDCGKESDEDRARTVQKKGREMTSLLKRIILGLAMLAIPAGPIAARADSAASARAEAKKHFDRAKELNEDGQTAEAVVELKRCYELSPHHTVLYNLGQAYITLAKPVEAVAALQRYLDEGGKAIKPARRAEVEQEIARQKTRIATLEIRGLPEGALVMIDGDEAGKAPLAAPVRVGVGKHVVAATATGYEPGEVKIEIVGEDSKVVELKLVPKAGQRLAAASSPSPAPPPAPAPAPGMSLAPAQGEVATSAESSNWSGFRDAGIVAASVGVVALVTGGILWAAATNKNDDAVSQWQTDQSQARSTRSDAENLATGANVCLIVGGVLAGVGAITTLLTFVDDASAKSVALAPALGPSFAGLTMRGNW